MKYYIIIFVVLWGTLQSYSQNNSFKGVEVKIGNDVLKLSEEGLLFRLLLYKEGDFKNINLNFISLKEINKEKLIIYSFI